MYHEVNTRYNVFFNANQAYNEALKSKEESRQDNLSTMIDVYPVDPDAMEKKTTGGAFDISVDKTTKAIKTHSITAKPERDPSKRKSIEYKEWLNSREFNPFLKNAWLLLGKSEYQNNDFLLASSTFSYITRLYKNEPEVVVEARLWLARTYLAMDWLYEAEDILYNIDLSGAVPANLEGDYAQIYADLWMRKKDYQKAIPYLEKAITIEHNKLQKVRLKYLLGQTYAFLGNKEKAFEAFESVQGLNTPYQFDFNSRIQQAAFANGTSQKKILLDLEKMSKDSKNKDYLDQVYFAIGNIYLSENDTTKTIEFYKKAIENSTRNGYDKAIAQISLGDIYFKRKEYVLAQPCYSEALSAISKKHDAFPRVELRSKVLDELVVYVQDIQYQDSLQNLARMSEEGRLYIINKVISDLKKKQEAERRESQREINATNTSLFESNTPESPVVSNDKVNKTSFYFYNPQIVAQGKSAFQNKWGNRKLEDGWRLKNKRPVIVQQIDLEEASGDQNDSLSQHVKLPTNSDVYSVEHYLAEIPMTPDALAKSNEIIEDAYFNMGIIYKDKLEDYTLAIDAFETDLRRFPNTPNLEEIYYQLFLIYLRLADQAMTELYRSHILNDFPRGDYAATLSNADYQWNLRNIYKIQDDLYQETYDAYLKGQIQVVRDNYSSMSKKYPLSDLMPKFLYLNALTYAQTNNRSEFKANLTELVEKYPKSDVSEVASEILKGLLSGKELSKDSSPSRGMIWDIKFGDGKQIEDAAGVDFVANPDSEYLLLFVYQSMTVNKNQLIYDIANYNFTNFVYKTFDLSFSQVNSLEMIQVSGFDSFKQIDDYINLAFEENSLMSQLDPSIITVPISTDNFIALMNGKSLNEYFLFFEKNYTKEMVKLILYWDKQRKNAGQKIQSEKSEDEIRQIDQIKEDVEATMQEVKPTQDSNGSIQKPLENTQSGAIEDGFPETMIDKTNNPVDGLKGILKSATDRTKLTKEEQKAIKQARELEIEKEKARKDQEKARIKAIEESTKMKQDSIDNARKQHEAQKRAILEAKQQAVKQKIKERENARKERQRELKEKERAQKEKLKQKQKARKEQLKKREQERKEKARQIK